MAYQYLINYFNLHNDESLIAMLACVPLESHKSVRSACCRFNSIVRSDAFHQQRAHSGYVESAVIVAGGYVDEVDEATSACWIFSRGETRPAAPLSVRRSKATSAIFNGEFWVVGGHDHDIGMWTTVEAYNFRTNTWRSCASLHWSRTCAAAGVVGDALVVAGGFRIMHVDVPGTAEAYNAAMDRWILLPDLPHEATQAAAGVLNGQFYLVGESVVGNAPKTQMWDGSRWTVKSDMPAIVGSFCTCAVHDHRMMLVSFTEGPERRWNCLAYDPSSDIWETIALLQAYVTQPLCMIEHAGSVLVIGGASPVRYEDDKWIVLTEDKFPDCHDANCVILSGCCSASVVLG